MTDIYQCYGRMAIFQHLVLCLQLLLQLSLEFSKTFQLLFPWPEEDHVILGLCLAAFYKSYGHLSVLAVLSTEVLVSTTPTFLKGF